MLAARALARAERRFLHRRPLRTNERLAYSRLATTTAAWSAITREKPSLSGRRREHYRNPSKQHRTSTRSPIDRRRVEDLLLELGERRDEEAMIARLRHREARPAIGRALAGAFDTLPRAPSSLGTALHTAVLRASTQALSISLITAPAFFQSAARGASATCTSSMGAHRPARIVRLAAAGGIDRPPPEANHESDTLRLRGRGHQRREGPEEEEDDDDEEDAAADEPPP